jgi:hypothetical protein
MRQEREAEALAVANEAEAERQRQDAEWRNPMNPIWWERSSGFGGW